MMSSNSDEMKYALSSSVNVTNFVTVKPCLEGDDISDFKMWEEQMLCLLESQDVVGFVNGDVEPPIKEASEQHYKEWRRQDRLVKGWILGSIGKDALKAVWGEPTARAAWLELHRIFESTFSQEDCRDDFQRDLPQDSCDHDQRGDEDFSKYSAVYKAAQVGDWDAAKNFFEGNIDELSTTIISRDSETALHVAVLAGRTVNYFVRRAVEATLPEVLALKDSAGRTALHNAAIVGNTEAAAALVRKNPNLLYIMNYTMTRFPVHEAAIHCQKETLKYLISEHEADTERRCLLFEGEHGIRLLNEIIASQFVDIALYLVHKYQNLARQYGSALTVIAGTYNLFRSQYIFTWWQDFIYHSIPLKRWEFEAHSCTTSLATDVENPSSDDATRSSFQIISRVGQKMEAMFWNAIEYLVPMVNELKVIKAEHGQALQLAQYLCDRIVSELPGKEASEILNVSIIEAAKYGVSEIAEMIIEKDPSIIYHGDPGSGMNVFMLAASYRYENVFNLIYNMSDRINMLFNSTDNKGNNLLHTCGKLAPPHRLNLVAGAALQMQREIHWFKEMEKFVNPSHGAQLNMDGKTPEMIFIEEHEALRREGEKWMKETSNACTIAAALIATVMFAAAFTVPGGLDTTTGVPLFAGQTAFNIFIVSDTVSLFTSIDSLLAFLSIVTSRHAEEDFLYLTKTLSAGMLRLFVAITSMLVAFSATLYLVPYANAKITWFAIVLGATAYLPATSLVLVQFPLIVDVVYSTYGVGIFGKRSNRMLY